MTYFPWLIDNEGVATLNPDYVLDFAESDDHLTLTYTLNPEAVWHSGEPITAADWKATWNSLNGLNPEFQVVSTEGYDLISSVEQGADEFEVVVTFCAARTPTTRRCSRASPRLRRSPIPRRTTPAGSARSTTTG